MSNKIASSEFAEFCNRDSFLRPQIDESTLNSVERPDAWIYVTVDFICDEREDEYAFRR